MTTHKFDFYADPGHGWLKVTQKHLNLIGMKVSDFTRYSFVKGDALYLEEDCDAHNFLRTWKSHFGEPIIKSHHTNRSSRIRSYERVPA